MADSRLLPSSLNDRRGRGFLACLDLVCGLDLDQTLMYWMDQAPAAALPFLAAQFSVLGLDGWEMVSTDAEKRALIGEAIHLHRHKGTPWALKAALAAVGWPGLTLEERLPTLTHDGTSRRDASIRYNGGARWAMFRVGQAIPETAVAAADLETVRGVVEAWKPARCVLESVRFSLAFTGTLKSVGHYDGATLHDGSIKHEGAPVGSLGILAVSSGGSEVYRRQVDTVARNGGQVTVSAVLDSEEANGHQLDTFTLYTLGGALVTSATRPPIEKTRALSLECVWTLTIQENA